MVLGSQSAKSGTAMISAKVATITKTKGVTDL
jgi:hypothetical protein